MSGNQAVLPGRTPHPPLAIFSASWSCYGAIPHAAAPGIPGTDVPNVAKQPKACPLARFGRLAAHGDGTYLPSRQMYNALLRLARFGAITASN